MVEFSDSVVKKLARYIGDIIPEKDNLKDYFFVSGSMYIVCMLLLLCSHMNLILSADNIFFFIDLVWIYVQLLSLFVWVLSIRGVAMMSGAREQKHTDGAPPSISENSLWAEKGRHLFSSAPHQSVTKKTMNQKPDFRAPHLGARGRLPPSFLSYASPQHWSILCSKFNSDIPVSGLFSTCVSPYKQLALLLLYMSFQINGKNYNVIDLTLLLCILRDMGT